jgi:NitT/TauT family transport system ATP-binding protein
LPHARAGGISGLLELLVDAGGTTDLPRLTQRLGLEVDDLLPILDAAVLLGFAQVAAGHIAITPVGEEFANARIQDSELFRKQVLAHAPLVSEITQALHQKKDGTMRAGFFLDLLDDHYPEAEAERQFATAVDWGRYAELFEYDADQERLRLPDPESSAPVGEDGTPVLGA